MRCDDCADVSMKFFEGVKFDDGKSVLDLLDSEAMDYLGKVLGFGARNRILRHFATSFFPKLRF